MHPSLDVDHFCLSLLIYWEHLPLLFSPSLLSSEDAIYLKLGIYLRWARCTERPLFLKEWKELERFSLASLPPPITSHVSKSHSILASVGFWFSRQIGACPQGPGIWETKGVSAEQILRWGKGGDLLLFSISPRRYLASTHSLITSWGSECTAETYPK